MAQTSHKRDPVEATDVDDKDVLLMTLDEDRKVVANLVVDVGLLSERRLRARRRPYLQLQGTYQDGPDRDPA